jgi:pimeloyl-ACP methyl ester carboxylesterase
MDAKATSEPRQRFLPLPGRGGGEMAYLDFGPERRPVDVVFSHANGFNARAYASILAPLAELRILAVDARGHGATTLPTEPDRWTGWQGYRDDLLAFLAAAADGPVVLSGHSMGGMASVLAAAAEPARVKALALFDPVVFEAALAPRMTGPNPLADGADRRRADFASKAAVFEAYRGRGAFRTWSDAQLADYIEAGFRNAEGGGVTLACRPQWEAHNFRTHNYDPWTAFRQLRCPVRVLKAEIDSTAQFGAHEPEILATGRVSIETVPGTTHFLPMERPDLVRETLRAVCG